MSEKDLQDAIRAMRKLTAAFRLKSPAPSRQRLLAVVD
jgi:hypothetical protein